jgi:hypothetical protein
MTTATEQPTTDPHNGKPVLGDPDFRAQEQTEDIFGKPCLTDPDSAGWDLSGGARISFGPDEDTTNLYVTLSISDYAQATGIVKRAVTRPQLIAHAVHLLRIAGAELTSAGTEDAKTRQPRAPQEHDHSVRLDGSGCPACGYVTSMVPAGQDRHA